MTWKEKIDEIKSKISPASKGPIKDAREMVENLIALSDLNLLRNEYLKRSVEFIRDLREPGFSLDEKIHHEIHQDGEYLLATLVEIGLYGPKPDEDLFREVMLSAAEQVAAAEVADGSGS